MIEALWQRYQAGGYAALVAAEPPDAQSCFYLALIAYAEGDLVRAQAWIEQTARVAPTRLHVEAAAYLRRAAQPAASVYADGVAFTAFIRGGGNIPLYAAVSAALREVYGEYESLRLLDIGVGDGLALLPALTAAVTDLDLLEPSAALLARTTAALDERGTPYRAHNLSIQAFMQTDHNPWDVIQATWSLQSLPPDERPTVFDWLRAHARRALIAEFDVPDFDAPLAPARVRYMIDRYARGLAEYEGPLVAQGFLLHIFFGAFDRTAARTNWEGPIADWEGSLRAAGFHSVQRRLLFPYWWADAYLLDAR